MKPYEKFLAKGPEFLTDAELLAIIIRTGTPEDDSVELGRKVLELPTGGRSGIRGLHHVSVNELMQIRGIGKVKAVKIKCITELSRRIAQADRLEKLQFTKPETVADYYMEQLCHLETEQVVLVMTDNKNRLLNEMVISQGTVNCSLMSPREIFRQALLYQAVHILLIHNHPSGDCTPSKQDIEITKHLAGLSQMMQIPLIDHIVIGDNCYTSFKETGLI